MFQTRLTEPLRVLVVDSWSDAADSLAMLLRLHGFDVSVAYDGPSALASAYINPPAAVIAELALPGLDGYRVAECLRREPRSENALLVAWTGYGQARHRAQAYESGFDYYLLKGCDPEEVLVVLSELRRARLGLPDESSILCAHLV
jgi:two-component system CheB/CheR fusion protein